ncbi:TetR/AcrR family transcriptional regulator [Gemmatimonas sp.]|uniref:TetR/AcrR family transcriptional regulator n=1 Tax=Gemmatimonas sp. TaxID=1962908 RepID=UPI0039833FD5
MPTEQKPTDRRVTRSKQLLLDALRWRLMEVGYEKVTIQSILDRAGVGRATFYAHFESKDDLLSSSISRLHEGLKTAGKQSGRARFGFSLPFFTHLASHRAIYATSMCQEDEITVERMIRRMLRDLVRDEVSTRAKPTDAEGLTIEFIVGALWSTIVWWMNSGSSMSPIEIDAHFRQLILAALDARSERP